MVAGGRIVYMFAALDSHGVDHRQYDELRLGHLRAHDTWGRSRRAGHAGPVSWELHGAARRQAF